MASFVQLAHGVSIGREDLTIPVELFNLGAAIVLILSFLGLAVLWRRPELQEPHERTVAQLPRRPLAILCGLVGLGLFGLLTYAGLAGAQNQQENITPTFVYVHFWVGIPLLSLFLGDVFGALNPWRALGRAAGWLGTRIVGGDAPPPLSYPQRLGRWPAVVGLLAFAWVELVASWGQDPSALALCMLGYAAVMLVGMTLFGIEPWTRNADAFSVYFGLFAALSPLRWEAGRLNVRRPLAGVAQLVALPGTVALLVVMIGSTTFDGFTGGPIWTGGDADGWQGLAVTFTDAFAGLGFAQDTALELAFTLGLALAVLAVGGFYRLGIAGVCTVDRTRPAPALAVTFAHTLVPIALAYLLAHYFSLLAFTGQATAYLASDPLGTGANLFGTATATIDYTILSASAIWYVQLGALIVGHVAGLVLAHDRALALYGDGSLATRSQYWMLAVMVGFTSLALYLLSA